MTVFRFDEAAAATAAGTVINQGQLGQQESRNRVINRIAVIGSAAIGDSALDLYIGKVFVGRYGPTTAGNVRSATEAKDWLFLEPVPVPYNAQIIVQVATASTTNVLRFFVDVEYEEGGL